ncbi:MAG: RsmD family RNA methyltransferase [Gemmatimonadota bacterium]|nr:RsmD family RNA methyltransferase [Gemmatimonadota bacterium]
MRPTLDSVREAWMSILQAHVADARVLDLFAGSGALGLEALSRGAASADFIERDPRALRALEANIAALGATDGVVIRRTDALRYAQSLARDAYEIAFADPPYEGGGAAALAKLWLETPFAAILSIEHSSKESLPPGGDTRRYGSTAITFYRSED